MGSSQTIAGDGVQHRGAEKSKANGNEEKVQHESLEG
jgi:hypothetical protein